MLTTRTRMQGNSVVVTLPANNIIKPESNKEYVVVYSEDGTITLVPKIDDPFVVKEEGAYYEKDEWEDVDPDGGEEI